MAGDILASSSNSPSSQLKQGKIDMDSKIKDEESSHETKNIADEVGNVHIASSLNKGTKITSKDSGIVDSTDNNINSGDCRDQNLVDTWEGTHKISVVHGCSRINVHSNNGGLRSSCASYAHFSKVQGHYGNAIIKTAEKLKA